MHSGTALDWRIEGMLQRFMPYNLIVRYRLHVSLLFLTVSLIHYAGQSDGVFWSLVFSLWHWALYVFNRFSDQREDSANNPHEATTGAHATAALVITVVALTSAAAMSLWASALPAFVLTLPFVFLYGFRFSPRFRIKDTLILKNIYAAVGCWVLPFMFIGLFAGAGAGLDMQTMIAALHIGMVVLVYELLWDIRDCVGDRSAGVGTVPVRFGVPLTKLIISLILVAHYLSALVLSGRSEWKITLYFAVWMLLLSERRAPWLYHAVLGGHLLVAAGYAVTALGSMA